MRYAHSVVTAERRKTRITLNHLPIPHLSVTDIITYLSSQYANKSHQATLSKLENSKYSSSKSVIDGLFPRYFTLLNIA